MKVSVVTVLFLSALSSVAAAQEAAIVIPYQGFLEHDGRPVTGTFDFEFALFTGLEAEEAAHSQPMTDVPVYGGEFTVLIEVSPDVLSAAELLETGTVYLQVALNADGTNIPLSGRQRVNPAPWSEYARGLTVVGPEVDVDAGQAALRVTDAGGARLHVDGDELQSSSQLRINTETGHGAIVSGPDARATESGVAGALVIESPGYELAIDGNQLESSSTLYINVEEANEIQIGHEDSTTTVQSDLVVEGALDARFRFISESIADGGNAWRDTLDCNDNERPISCGTLKSSGNEGHEDSLGCRIDWDNRRCQLWYDQNDGFAGGTHYCLCLQTD